MHTLRPATDTDLEFLIRIDLQDEGISAAYRTQDKKELAAHRLSVKSFIHDDGKGAWIAEDENGEPIGMILWRFRNRLTEVLQEWSVFNHIDPSHFDPDGRFCEIFQLWVDPRYRRQGLASMLKQVAERESVNRGIRTIYTHTESANSHVIDLNRKLGYSEVRRGPIWDDIERVSLIKHLS